jgi:hypothetical protein
MIKSARSIESGTVVRHDSSDFTAGSPSVSSASPARRERAWVFRRIRFSLSLAAARALRAFAARSAAVFTGFSPSLAFREDTGGFVLDCQYHRPRHIGRTVCPDDVLANYSTMQKTLHQDCRK